MMGVCSPLLRMLSTNVSTLVPNQRQWSRSNSAYDAMRAAIGNALGN